MSERPRPKVIERLEARRAEHRNRHPAYRIAFGVAGALVLIAGIVMLVTPGPAFVLIPVGLGMLALEFTWAERALDRALTQAQVAQEKAANASTAQRVAGTLAGAAAIAAAAFAAFYWNLGPF